MSKELSTNITTNMPDFLKSADASKGNENVSSTDVATPRLTLLQAMSPELKKSSPKHIPGAEEGKLAMDGKLYDNIKVINLFFEKEWTIFDGNRQFVSTHTSEKDAKSYLSVNGLDSNSNRIVETAKHACLHVDDNGNVLGPVAILMSSTKLRTSNKWNSDLMKSNAPRYATIWEITPVEETNPKGTYFNMKIDFVGYPSQEVYQMAESNSESLSALPAAA